MTEVPGTPSGAPEGTTPPASTPPAGTEEKMFPESYVKTLRDESANYRIQARDAAEQTRAAVLGEVAAQLAAKDAEINRLTAEVGDGWILQEKLNQSIAAGVPADKLAGFAAALQGVDTASIKASAESLRALLNITPADQAGVPPGATDPSQGRGQRGLANPGQDPILKALTEASSRR